MTKKKQNKSDWGEVGAIVGIIILFLTIIIALNDFEVFDKPRLKINSYTEFLGWNNNVFEIKLRNSGEKDSYVCINVYSGNINFTFINDKICMDLEKETPLEMFYNFKFLVNKSSFVEPKGNVSIFVNIEPINWDYEFQFIEWCDYSIYKSCSYNLKNISH